MVETILAWADLDTGVSRLIFLIFRMEDDAGSILIGNMDLKTKVEKIKMLYEHHGLLKDAPYISELVSAMKRYSDCRNVVAHRKCVGKLMSDPDRIVFLSAKHVKGTPGQFEMTAVDHTEFKASAKFARDAAIKVHDMIIALEDRVMADRSS